jgi:hypothetical protein
MVHAALIFVAAFLLDNEEAADLHTRPPWMGFAYYTVALVAVATCLIVDRAKEKP